MMKGVNSTIITLIPKSTHVDSVTNYRPTSCCNTICKFISKMLFQRLKQVLPSIISRNQSAFVAGRIFLQNVLICQNLVRLYSTKNTTKSCLINIDLRKVYDSVKWGFAKEILHGLNFPQKFSKWVMECITTQYTLAINGGTHGCIMGKRGLRQSDSISPLLFFICMEYFARIMN